MDARVQDYLEDRLQSSADLAILDTLLDTVKSQQELLKQQLDEAKRAHDEVDRRSRQHASSVREKANTFTKQQADIDRRLMIVTQSETSDEAAQKFEAGMAKLHRLDVAAGYVELLQEVDGLKQESASQLGKSDEKALEPFHKLQRLHLNLRPLQEVAEGAAPHLLDHIAQQVQSVRGSILASFSEDLNQTLTKMNWPRATETVPMALQEEWTSNVTRLLNLQQQELEDRDVRVLAHTSNDEPPALFPFVVMMHPIEQRFSYHFSGNKPTNRLDKPEYFLSHATDLISQYSDFLGNAVQPLLVYQFRGSDLALKPAYIDATSAFITALLPMVKGKLSSVASQMSNQPQLLSHLVQEVLSFDTTLQDSFSYAPESPATPWRGLSYYMLDTCGYFQPWLAAERDFALTRYRSIIDDSQARELDYDSVSSDATKPTKAAIRVNDLLETITDRYRLLSSFSQKLRFLMDIQIAIFDDFHQHLHSGLEAYLTVTSSIGRRVQGISREDSNELQGVKGLDRICRVFGSADYLERAMRDWSDDLFFLELWEELQMRARSGPNISRHFGGLQEIQQKTSAAVGNDGTSELQGALFDETAAAYHRLRVRSEGIVVDTVTYNLRESLRPYSRVGTWATLSSPAAAAAAATEGTVTAELDSTLRLVTDFFGFLSRALGKAALRRVARPVCHALQTFLWDHVLTRCSFSTAGAAQFAIDITALAARIDAFVGSGQARAGLRRLGEGVTLLNLPVQGQGAQKAKTTRETTGDDDDDDDDDEGTAWDEAGTDDGGDHEASSANGDERGMSLFEVERLVFMDNESARHVLQRLGLETLTESDARAVLERRVEIGS